MMELCSMSLSSLPTFSDGSLLDGGRGRSLSPKRTAATGSVAPHPQQQLRRERERTQQRAAASLSPKRRHTSSSRGRSRTTSTADQDKQRRQNGFFKYCNLHAHAVAREPRHSLPLNRLLAEAEEADGPFLSSPASNAVATITTKATSLVTRMGSLRNILSKTAMKQQEESHLFLQQQKELRQRQTLLEEFFPLHHQQQQQRLSATSHSSHHSTHSYRDDSLEPHARALVCSPQDVLHVVMDDALFCSLQQSLRKRGVITNNYLKENIHFWVKHQKEKRVQQKLKQQQRDHEQQQQQQQQRLLASRSPTRYSVRFCVRNS